MTGPGPQDSRAGHPPARWWQRAVPVGVLVALALGVAVLALPDDEIELSTSRLPQEYVELSLADEPPTVCGARADRRVPVRFRLVNHLESTQDFGYRVAVQRRGADAPERVRKRGRVRLAPGESALVRTRLARTPDRAHAVTIRLAHRPEHLRIHCRGQRQQEESA